MQHDGDGHPTTILHRGRRYCVRFLRCSDRRQAVVCFEYWVPSPSLDSEFAAEGFFRHRGTNAIGILAAENDWFQDGEIDAALAAIRAATDGFDLVGYGGSMGGFAAINFSAALGLRSVVAVCPQYSIDAARAPYEPRWRDEAAVIAGSGGFLHDYIDQVPALTDGWIIFDPACVDGRHAADIQARHALHELRIRFGGHDLMRMLQQADVYTGMLLDMLEDRFDPARFTRSWRHARRFSAVFWLGLADALCRRGDAKSALTAVQRARALPHPEPAAIDLAEARVLLALNETNRARDSAERWADDPGWGEAARSCLAQIPASEQRLLPAPEKLSPRSVAGRLRAWIRRRRAP